jgi:hypothetical protein
MNNKKVIDFAFFIVDQMRSAGYIYTHTGSISAAIDYCEGIIVRKSMMPGYIQYAISISERAHDEAKAAYDAAVRGPYNRDAQRAAAKHYQVCRAVRAIVRVVDYAIRGERGGFDHPWIGEEIAIAKASACIAIDADVRDDARRAIAAYEADVA